MDITECTDLADRVAATTSKQQYEVGMIDLTNVPDSTAGDRQLTGEHTAQQESLERHEASITKIKVTHQQVYVYN